MAILRAQLSLNHGSGDPADDVTNTFHFEGPPTEAVGAFIKDDLRNFFIGPNVGTTDFIFSRMSSSLTGYGEVRVYDLADAKPRSPIYSSGEILIFNATTGTPGPEECAVVCSYGAPSVSGLDQRHRRGRFYLGPLTWSTATYMQVAGKARVAVGFRDALCTAMKRLRERSLLAGHASWVVYSPTNDTTVGATRGWVDDAFDTIRSRGPVATARSTWTAPA